MSQPLWDHQRRALEFCKPLTGAALFLEMGCGKTRTALELLKVWQAKNILVVAPKAVLSVWEREVYKHTPEDFHPCLLSGPTPKKKEALLQALRLNRPTVFINNYESIWRSPLKETLLATMWDAVILDESHRCKAPGGVASMFLSNLGRRARRRLLLTGTPCPNNPLDIYAQYRFLNSTILGTSFQMFKNRYAVQEALKTYNPATGEKDKTYLVQNKRTGKMEPVMQVVNFKNLDDLHRRIYQCAFRVTSREVLTLPPEMEEVINFDLPAALMKHYREFKKEFVTFIQDEQVSAPSILVKLLRLSQLVGGMIKPDDTGIARRIDRTKLDVLQDLLMDMGAEPVVIFCRFIADIDGAKEVCQNLNLKVCELSGRVNEMEDFLNGQAQVIVCQIRSGGLGIDLTRARYCIYFSTGYSLGDHEQSKARVHRPGQTRPVVYYYLVARNTVDEDIIKALKEKKDIVQYIVDTLRGKKP